MLYFRLLDCLNIDEIVKQEALNIEHQYCFGEELAIKVATAAHAGQVDKGGNLYINHPKTVAESMTNTEYKIVTYLHDVCEDTPTTFDDLLNMGFTFRIVNSIRLLTKPDELTYEEYLRRLHMDSCARAVKVADLKHNMDLSRIKNPTEKDYVRIEKYKKSLAFLESSTHLAFYN